MFLESVFTGILSIVAIIFLFILIALAFFMYVAVNTIFFNLVWVIEFYKKYRPDPLLLKKAWLEYMERNNLEIKKDIEAYDPKEWEEKDKPK